MYNSKCFLLSEVVAFYYRFFSWSVIFIKKKYFKVVTVLIVMVVIDLIIKSVKSDMNELNLK